MSSTAFFTTGLRPAYEDNFFVGMRMLRAFHIENPGLPALGQRGGGEFERFLWTRFFHSRAIAQQEDLFALSVAPAILLPTKPAQLQAIFQPDVSLVSE